MNFAGTQAFSPQQSLIVSLAFFFHHSHLKQVSSLWSSAPRICIFFVGGFALKVFPEHGIEVISSVPKPKKAIIHLMEEIS